MCCPLTAVDSDSTPIGFCLVEDYVPDRTILQSWEAWTDFTRLSLENRTDARNHPSRRSKRIFKRSVEAANRHIRTVGAHGPSPASSTQIQTNPGIAAHAPKI